MNNQRRLLRDYKARCKEQLTSLKHYIRELTDQCQQCNADHQHTDPALMKAKYDVEFYERRIKDINRRLKDLSAKKSS